ncbi:MAG: hypothetical protein IPM02_22310 [Betaproteobacteria bacterium]|nr:hypothetical protein [Betaproteobacteria bacterium]
MSATRVGTSFALAAMFASATVCAQQAPDQRTVAKLVDLDGAVLVSQGDAMAAGAADQRLRPDTRVVTTAGSKVTINYDRGCNVRLEENQRFTVREFGECAALIASVESIGVAGGVAAAGTGGTGIAGLAVLGAAGVGAAIYGVTRNSGANVSPN